ncbi:MAG TPA: amidase family protein, partial [Acidimicrobiales bacterium]|nr:amidase family protein [Acidimicrobiales bacterium]
MALDDDTATWTATQLAAAIRAKDIASRELLDLYLDRIDRLDTTVRAVVTLDADRARDAATAADEATARGDALGPLHGLPVTIKDAIETEGIRSTGGAVELIDHVPTRDAPAVARLKDAGAVVFGKTNLPRWSGDLQSYNEMFGTTSNPWDPERVPGGSSGGAGAAVAAGFTSFEVGTDIAGSVRIPSHFCGVFGLKPSYGLIPQRGYLDHVGGGTTDADINV